MTERIAVGVNGPGMIGRDFTRMTHDNERYRIDVVAINHPHKEAAQQIGELLANCTIYGPWLGKRVELRNGTVTIDNHPIEIYTFPKPENIPWHEVGVKVVIESSRQYSDPIKAVAHLKEGGPHTVVISSSYGGSTTEDDSPPIVFGVNQQSYNPVKHRKVSVATCSSNCLAVAIAPFRKLGIRTLIAKTTHAATSENEVYDRVNGKLSIMNNFVDEKTGVSKTLFQLLPELKDDLDTEPMISCIRGPVSTGSVFTINLQLATPTTVDQVITMLQSNAMGPLQDVLHVSMRPIRSVRNVQGLEHAAIIPAPSLFVSNSGHWIQFNAYYDNIRGFNSQMGRVVRYISDQRT